MTLSKLDAIRQKELTWNNDKKLKKCAWCEKSLFPYSHIHPISEGLWMHEGCFNEYQQAKLSGVKE